jgi:hypothetical protein
LKSENITLLRDLNELTTPFAFGIPGSVFHPFSYLPRVIADPQAIIQLSTSDQLISNPAIAQQFTDYVQNSEFSFFTVTPVIQFILFIKKRRLNF